MPSADARRQRRPAPASAQTQRRRRSTRPAADSASVSTRMLARAAPDGAADADLARALGDRHERRVGDDHDRRDERHERDGRAGGADALGDVATNVREASGVMMSKVSAAPGARCRRARIEMRARSSARAVSGAPSGACGEDLQAGRRAERALERGERHPDVAIQRHAAGRALLRLHADDAEARGPPMRTGCPSGSRPGTARRRRPARDDDLRAGTSSSRVKNRPASSLDVADVEQRGLRAVDRRVLERAAAGARRPPDRCAVRRTRTRPSATLVEEPHVAAGDVGVARELVGQLAPAEVAGGDLASTNVSLPNARALVSRAERPGRRARSARPRSSPPPRPSRARPATRAAGCADVASASDHSRRRRVVRVSMISGVSWRTRHRRRRPQFAQRPGRDPTTTRCLRRCR